MGSAAAVRVAPIPRALRCWPVRPVAGLPIVRMLITTLGFPLVRRLAGAVTGELRPDPFGDQVAIRQHLNAHLYQPFRIERLDAFPFEAGCGIHPNHVPGNLQHPVMRDREFGHS